MHIDWEACGGTAILFVVLFLCLLKMAITAGISHYHLSIVMRKRGGSVSCCIATDKPYTTLISILF